jgi:hypothetical protein
MFLNKHGFVGKHKTSQAGHDLSRHHEMKAHNEAMKILLPLLPLLPLSSLSSPAPAIFKIVPHGQIAATANENPSLLTPDF